MCEHPTIRFRQFTLRGSKIYWEIIKANDGKAVDLYALQDFLTHDQFEGTLWTWKVCDPNDES